MLSSRKIIFFVVFVLVCIVIPLFAAEPNEPNEPNKPGTEPKFEVSNSPVRWSITNQPGRGPIGPIRPEYVAEFYIKRSNNIPNQNQYGKLDSLLQTNIGKSMSPSQKEFIETSSSYEYAYQPTEATPIGYGRIRLYAVSQDNAEKMAKAFIEQINENAQKNKKSTEEYLHKSEQALSQDKKDLTEKVSKLKEIEEAYKKIKEKTHQISSDDEAVDLAKKSIIEMDKMFNDLDIELAGIRARIKSIEDYRNSAQVPQVQAKLDSMYTDLMIELSGLEARRRVAEEIYSREQEFLSMFNKKTALQKGVDELNKKIISGQGNIERLTYALNLPDPDFLPADIYKNTVTIHWVGEENSIYRNR
jgi:hypothetical protein